MFWITLCCRFKNCCVFCFVLFSSLSGFVRKRWVFLRWGAGGGGGGGSRYQQCQFHSCFYNSVLFLFFRRAVQLGENKIPLKNGMNKSTDIIFYQHFVVCLEQSYWSVVQPWRLWTCQSVVQPWRLWTCQSVVWPWRLWTCQSVVQPWRLWTCQSVVWPWRLWTCQSSLGGCGHASLWSGLGGCGHASPALEAVDMSVQPWRLWTCQSSLGGCGHTRPALEAVDMPVCGLALEAVMQTVYVVRALFRTVSILS